MAETIPLRQMVLYKHGVAFHTRQGTVEGGEFVLPLRADEVDDALKSLVVLTLDGGRVRSVRYVTPDRDGSEEIALGDEHALFDLLRSVQGTRVRVFRLDGQMQEGRIVGVETHPQGREHSAMLVLLTERETVRQVPTGSIGHIALEDGRTARAIGGYLDRAAGEELERAITVALDEPGRQVQVSYTVASSIWRVAYRFVGSRQEERALLQGWGIFDNRTGEDLQDVEVTLVAGQPVSFKYDLTSSVIPPRRVVQDEARVAAGPVEFAAGVPAAAPGPPEEQARLMPSLAQEVDVPAFVGRVGHRPRQAKPADVAEATLLSATTQDLDELFECRLGAVSVGKDESAMVPIVQRDLPYQRELLYNAGKLPKHPVVAFRLRNGTGMTLERGPVTIVEDGQYRGEAILPFTKTGSELFLAYAVELGISVQVDVESQLQEDSLEIRGRYLLLQDAATRTTIYSLANNTDRNEVVTVEQAKSGGAELVGTRAPNEETPEVYRWRVACPARRETIFTVHDRSIRRRREALLDQNLEELARYLRDRPLDAETRERLTTFLRLRQRLADIDEEVERLRDEQSTIGEREDRLRRNLTILPASEQEAEIRRRSAEEMTRQQVREAEIETRIGELRAERREAEEALRAELAMLGAEEEG